MDGVEVSQRQRNRLQLTRRPDRAARLATDQFEGGNGHVVGLVHNLGYLPALQVRSAAISWVYRLCWYQALISTDWPPGAQATATAEAHPAS